MLRSFVISLISMATLAHANADVGSASPTCADRFKAGRAQDSIVAMAYASAGSAVAVSPYFLSQWFVKEDLGAIGNFSRPVKLSMLAIAGVASWIGMRAYQDYHFGNLVFESIRGAEQGTVNKSHARLARYFNRNLYSPARISWRNPTARLSKIEREERRQAIDQRNLDARDVFTITRELTQDPAFCDRDISPLQWVDMMVEKFRVAR